MINPINYDYNTAIYPYLRVQSTSNAVNPVSRINRIAPVDDKSSLSVGKLKSPEYRTPYAKGGTAVTSIEYNTENPYEKARKSIEGSLLTGMHVDYVA